MAAAIRRQPWRISAPRFALSRKVLPRAHERSHGGRDQAAAERRKAMNETRRLGWTRAAQRGILSVLATVAAVGAASAVLAPPANAALPYGPFTCKSGFVWREAFPGDRVCVTPANRQAVRTENALGPSRRSPTGGPYGPATCRPGFVWREARPSDLVCVPPASRSREVSNNGSAVFRLEDPTQVPRGGVSVRTSYHQLGGTITAFGGGASPNGLVRFYAFGFHNNTGRWGPYSLGSLRANAGGGVSGWVGHLYCRSNQSGPATIVAVDAKSGAVTTAGTSGAVTHCGW